MHNLQRSVPTQWLWSLVACPPAMHMPLPTTALPPLPLWCLQVSALVARPNKMSRWRRSWDFWHWYA